LHEEMHFETQITNHIKHFPLHFSSTTRLTHSLFPCLVFPFHDLVLLFLFFPLARRKTYDSLMNVLSFCCYIYKNLSIYLSQPLSVLKTPIEKGGGQKSRRKMTKFDIYVSISFLLFFLRP
jgi:hypothetical protein